MLRVPSTISGNGFPSLCPPEENGGETMKLDGKPRLAEAAAKRRRVGFARRMASTGRGGPLRARRYVENAGITGRLVMRDEAPSGRRTGLVIGSTGPQGGISVNPMTTLAYMIRRALRPRVPVAPCFVYDSEGRVIATIDPVTRQRKPIGKAVCKPDEGAD